jgi:hypothetical protein
MDTESFFFIGVLCFLSAAVTFLLPIRKVRISNYILSMLSAISDERKIYLSKKDSVMPGRTDK